MTEKPKDRWWRSLQCNNNSSWRDIAGAILRKVADRIDKRTSLAIRIETHPEIPQGAKNAIMRRGLDHMGRLLDITVRDEGVERAFCRTHSELFE